MERIHLSKTARNPALAGPGKNARKRWGGRQDKTSKNQGRFCNTELAKVVRVFTGGVRPFILVGATEGGSEAKSLWRPEKSLLLSWFRNWCPGNGIQ